MAQQYKHAIPANDYDLIANHNLFDITGKNVKNQVLGGVLNSSFVVLSKFQYGRPVGVEGNLKTEVIDVNMMLVPDPRHASANAVERAAKAFTKMKGRSALYLLPERRLRQMSYTQSGKTRELATLDDRSELDMPDRRELDDAVLEMLGEKSPQRRREILDELYAYLREFFEHTRQKEEAAILNKNKSKRKGPAKPEDIAGAIHQVLTEKEPKLLLRYDPDFVDPAQPYDTFNLPSDGKPEALHLPPNAVAFKKGKKTLAGVEAKSADQVKLIIQLANSGVRGFVRVPHEDQECRRVLGRYQDFLARRAQRLRALIEERNADKDIQEKTYTVLLARLVR